MDTNASLAVVSRVRELVSVYMACGTLTAGTLYTDGLLDAVEALGGSREDPPVPVQRLMSREQDVAGAALGPILADLEEALEQIAREAADRATAGAADLRYALAAG